MASKKQDQVAKLTNMLKADKKEKVSKVRNQYGIIQNLNIFQEHLNGRKVRVVPGSNPDHIYGVVQYPGYEGLVLSFEPNEVKLL